MRAKTTGGGGIQRHVTELSMLESRWPSGMVSIIFLLQKEVPQYQYFGIDVGSSLVSTFKQINSQQ